MLNVVFFIVILRFCAIRNLLSDLTLSEFPLLRRVKATYSIGKSLLLEAEKKTLKACQLPQFLHRIIAQGSALRSS